MKRNEQRNENVWREEAGDRRWTESEKTLFRDVEMVEEVGSREEGKSGFLIVQYFPPLNMYTSPSLQREERGGRAAAAANRRLEGG